MVAINRLTGHSRGFFSVFTLPPNQVTSIERQRKNNERRNQQPEYRDVADLIRRETRSLDIVNYRADNWMRCWFAGIDPDRVGITQTGKLEAWKGLVRETVWEPICGVRHDVVLRTEHRQDAIAGIVVSQVHRDGPLQHEPDSLAHGAGFVSAFTYQIGERISSTSAVLTWETGRLPTRGKA